MSDWAVCAHRPPGAARGGPSPHSAPPPPPHRWSGGNWEMPPAPSPPSGSTSLGTSSKGLCRAAPPRTWTWPLCRAAGSFLPGGLYIGRCLLPPGCRGRGPLPPLRHQHTGESAPQQSGLDSFLPAPGPGGGGREAEGCSEMPSPGEAVPRAAACPGQWSLAAGPPRGAPLLNAGSPSRVPRLLDDGGSTVAPPLALRPGASLLPAAACF